MKEVLKTVTEKVSLPQWLADRGKKVKGVKVYGTLMGAVAPPPPYDTLPVITPNSDFGVLDIVAFEHEGKLYWTEGKIMAVVSTYSFKEASDKPSKRLAVSISGGRLELSHKNIVMLYNFRMQDGRFCLGKSFVEKLTTEKYGQILEVIASGASTKWKQYTFPVDQDVEIDQASNNYRFEFLGQWAEWVHNPPSVDTSIATQAINGVTGKPLGIQETVQDNNLGLESSSSSSGETSQSSGGGLLGKMGHNGVITPPSVPNGFKPRLKSTLMRVDPTKVKPDYQRLEPEPYSEIMLEYETAYSSSSMKITNLFDDAKSYDAPYNLFEILREGIALGLQRNAKGTLLGKSTKKFFTDTLLEIIKTNESDGFPTGEVEEDDEETTLTASDIAKDFEMFEYDILGGISDNANISCKTAKFVNNNRDAVMFKILEQILDVRKGGYRGLSAKFGWQGVDKVALLANNLYMTALFQPSLTVENLDKLRMLMGVEMTEDMSKVRNAIKVHSWLVDQNNQILMSSTVHKKNVLMTQLKAGFTLTNNQYEKIFKVTGGVLPTEKLRAVKAIFGDSIEGTEFNLPSTGWERGYKQWTYTGGCTTAKLIQDAVEVGVLVELQSPETGETLYADLGIMKKELYVYSKLYAMLDKQAVSLTEEEEQELIQEFQSLKDKELGLPSGTFQLEERQKQSIKLLNYTVGILTGGAGSGKTTTAEFLLHAIVKKLDVTDDNIFFAAPTGKAAQRLSEVVKKPAYTLHRLFGLDVGTSYPLTPNHREKELDNLKVLLIDETSIANIDVLYSVMLNISEDTIVYFLGDEDQLPPIGFGKPLASMLTFLPTIHLNVSKRAAAGSKITVNANRIIDPTDKRELEEDDSFKIIQEKDAQIGLAILKTMITYHISEEGENQHLTEFFKPVTTIGQGLTSSDIQIISPYSSSNTCAYTSKIVNKMAQEIFNPLAKHQQVLSLSPSTYEKEPPQYRIGDRVIHVNSNIADRRRFKHVRGTLFEMDKSTGVYNGDVGVIKGFVPLTSLNISVGDVSETEFTDYDKRILRMVRKVQQQQESGNIFQEVNPTGFVAVEYEGVNDNGQLEKFIILYLYHEVMRDGKVTYIQLGELVNVELAYCLTTHKLQGSQAKLVICLLFPHGRKTDMPFISRNMLYTGITRAQKGCYLLGDIWGSESVVNHGRTYQANTTRKTVYDYI